MQTRIRHAGWTALIAVTTLAGAGAPPLAGQEEMAVLDRWFDWQDAEHRLRESFNQTAFRFLDRRQERLSSLQAPSDWEHYRDEVRQKLHEVVGPFPERTPLNPQVLGTLNQEGYRVEKLVFESQPDFYVTACLFIPDERQDPAPAILNVIGHTGIAFRAEGYQRFLLNLVRKGFVVLVIDPLGQGERLQYYDPEKGGSVIGGSTTEHSYFGMQCFLTGDSAAKYFAWDGIRALDYLVTRPEVDPDRIGVTGLSGGGTQTSYLMALDDRVAAAAPTCYITGFRRLLSSIGPQDAEQNFLYGLREGIDHGDFLLARMPKPTLVVATTRDFFSIQGTREVVAEARPGYEALQAGDSLQLAVDDHGHGFTPKNNESTYAFFQRHLALPGDPAYEPVETLTPDELTVTPTGQLSTSLGGETVFTLNRANAAELLSDLERAREDIASHRAAVPDAARRISGFREPGPEQDVVFRGRHQQEGYQIQEYALQSEDNRILPLLLAVPDGKRPASCLLYLHPEGKTAAIQQGDGIEPWVAAGYAVLAPDLSDVGELDRNAQGHGRNILSFLGAQIGRSVVGARATEIARCLRFLETRQELDVSDITALAQGSLAVPLLHIASWDRRIGQVALIRPLISYRSVVMNRFYDIPPNDLVPGALTAYDLPDLAAALAPRPLLLAEPMDQQRTPLSREGLHEEATVIRAAYEATTATGALTIETELAEPIGRPLRRWLQSLDER